MTAKEKNRLAGIFLLIHGGLFSFVAILIIGFFTFVSLIDNEALFLMIFAVACGIIYLGMALPQIIGGWKMIKEKPDARNWAIAGAIVACLNAPLGTAAGVFALIFLFGEDGKRFYSEGGNQNYLPNFSPNQTLNQDLFQNTPREPYNWK